MEKSGEAGVPAVNLIVTGGGLPEWDAGALVDGRGGAGACAAAVRRALEGRGGEWILFWDAGLGEPPEGLLRELTGRQGDVWHGGLDLGLRGQPALFDAVTPCWMLHGDPGEGVEGSSWRLSLRCALVRRALLEAVGGLDGAYVSMEGAGLDLGYRCLAAGAMMRHVPGLAGGVPATGVPIPLVDEARLVSRAKGRKWLAYGLARAVMTGRCGAREALRAYRAARDAGRVRLGVWRMGADWSGGEGCGGSAGGRSGELPSGGGSLLGSSGDSPLRPRGGGEEGFGGSGGGRSGQSPAKVTVLVPTVDRYPYLRTLMRQLAVQTAPPHEVIVVDQTAPGERERSWQEEAHGLPLRVMEMEQAGQCSSRNAGLGASTGEWILFLDDDDEVPPDLIERFLASAEETGADVVCGVAEEAGAGALPEWFRFRRMSDVFPTGASLARREALERSGLFDLAYERGARADGDLGMRLYRSGARMVLDPALRVFHHHAPRGGLRRHKARTVTHARSRQSIRTRRLPEVTELYLALRYCTADQVREMLWISALGTLAVRGARWRKLAKACLGLALLPATVWELRKRMQAARRMLGTYPRIERLETESGL